MWIFGGRAFLAAFLEAGEVTEAWITDHGDSWAVLNLICEETRRL